MNDILFHSSGQIASQENVCKVGVPKETFWSRWQRTNQRKFNQHKEQSMLRHTGLKQKPIIRSVRFEHWICVKHFNKSIESSSCGKQLIFKLITMKKFLLVLVLHCSETKIVFPPELEVSYDKAARDRKVRGKINEKIGQAELRGSGEE